MDPTRMLSLVLLTIVAISVVCIVGGSAFQNEELYQIRESWLPHVQTSKGLLQGSTVVTERGNTGFAFQGTPFIEPPIGRLRFLPPVRKTAWSGTYLADKYPGVCPQNPQFSNLSIDIQSEDCVYLMIYTPTVDFSSLTNETSPKYPVVYYIHGGGFSYDSPAMFPPEKIIDHFTADGVIFIMVAYRLGPFGFFTLGTDENQGNMGMKDIIMGLEWIQDEIGFLGGDPGRVTLMGHSSGAGAASLLTMLPATDGLVHQVISMSGASVLQGQSAVSSYHDLPNALGCSTNVSGASVSYYAILNCLQSFNTSTIFDTYQNLSLNMGPRIDGQLIPTDVQTLQKTRRPMTGLFGTTSNEFPFIALFIGSPITPEIVRTFCTGIASAAAPNASELASQVCSDFYVDRYITSVPANDSAFWTEQLNTISSMTIYIGSRADALSLRNVGDKVGFYQFSYVKQGYEGFAPYHAMDLSFLLGLHPLPTNTADDERIGDIQAALFSNFVKTTNPTPEVNSTFPKWTILELHDGYNYYDINLNLTMKDYYKFEDIQLWTVVIPFLQNFALSSKSDDQSSKNATNVQPISVAFLQQQKVIDKLRLLTLNAKSQNSDFDENFDMMEELNLLMSGANANDNPVSAISASDKTGAAGSSILIGMAVGCGLLVAITLVILKVKRNKRNQYRTV